MPNISINGTLLHAETFGDIHNPILVFLHGGPGADYRALISEKDVENASRYPNERTITNGGLSQLQDEYYCVFYDQRGAGLSPRFDKGEVDFETYLNDLDAIINYYLERKEEETGIVENQVRIFAWSFGGILSTGYINQNPDKVKDIVFYEPAPISKEIWEYFNENMTQVYAQIGSDWLEEYVLSKNHLTPNDHIRADYELVIPAADSQPEFHQDGDMPFWRIGALIKDENLDFMMSKEYDITSGLNEFKGKAFFIVGEKTLDELPEYPDLQMKYYPTIELTTLPGVGHTGPWEKSDELASIIRKFLKNNEPLN